MLVGLYEVSSYDVWDEVLTCPCRDSQQRHDALKKEKVQVMVQKKAQSSKFSMFLMETAFDLLVLTKHEQKKLRK